MFKWLGLILLFCGLDLAATSAFYLMANKTQCDQETKADLGVVFHTNSTNLLQNRLATSVSLVLSDDIHHLKTVGGMRPLQGRIGAVDMAIRATMLGVPDDRVSADRTSNDTMSSLQDVAQSSRELNATSITFISESMHLLRVRHLKDRVDWEGAIHHYVCIAPKDLKSIWIQAHYEAGAWVVSYLPEQLKRRVIETLRP